MIKVYSDDFKKAAVQKFLNRGARTIADIERETGVGDTALYAWVKKHARSTGVSMIDSKLRPQDKSTQDKMKSVFEFDILESENRGEYLRKNGLHSEHIDRWRQMMAAALEHPELRTTTRSEVLELNRKIKELERDINRKDKALAETTALLVLKKKADLIWGIHENG